MKNTLYFFTASYPFDYRESFIEKEIHYLSLNFSKIVIIPLFGDIKIKRDVPDNCVVIKPIISNKIQHYCLGLFGSETMLSFYKYFFKNKVYLNRKRAFNFFTTLCTTNALIHSKQFKIIIKTITSNDYMYFYWGVGSSQVLPFIEKIKAKIIVRFHGEWDLWEESSGGCIPLRNEVLQKVDLAVFISSKGKDYLIKKYPYIQSKSIVSYLGTTDLGVCQCSNDGIIRILSCSSLIPLKRVELILDSIKTINNTLVEWTHIGDGPGMKSLIEKSKDLGSNINIRLLGRLSNEDVLKYYMTHSVDVFINVSSIEGLPVTLMESISFNVPVIATNVGGVSELVNKDTGILLSPNPSPEEIVDAILKISSTKLNPKLIWNAKFNAENNYNAFINTIKNL